MIYNVVEAQDNDPNLFDNKYKFQVEVFDGVGVAISKYNGQRLEFTLEEIGSLNIELLSRLYAS